MKARKIFKAALVLAAVAAIAAAGAWRLDKIVPAGPAEGTTLLGRTAAARRAGGTIRVGTLNIRRCLDEQYKDILPQVTELIAKQRLDVVGLNEVAGPEIFGWDDQAAKLAKRLGVSWLFAPSERRWARGSFGNAILSALPASRWERRPLEGTVGSYRSTLHVVLEHNGRPINVLIAHVGRGADRDPQLSLVLERFLAMPAPAVLLGDLNATSDDPQIKELLRRPGVQDAAAGIAGGAGRVDYIITRGMACKRAKAIPAFEKAHLLLTAELEPMEMPATLPAAQTTLPKP